MITFATVVSLATTVLCGLLPAWRSARTDGLVAFKGEIVAGVPRRRPLGLIAQVVMSFVLLLVAGTFVQALVRMQTADPGFAVAGRLYAYVFISTPGVTPATGRQIYSHAIDQLQALPGVRTATLSYSLPLMPTASDCAARQNGPRIAITTGSVDPGYFGTMDIGMSAGRDFAPSDNPSDAAVVIVNERLASGLWPNASRNWRTRADRMPRGHAGDGDRSRPRLLDSLARREAAAAPLLPVRAELPGGLTAILLETSTRPAR